MAELEHEHTADAIAERLSGPQNPGYLRDWILGGIDGAVTTFAIVAGIAGAGLAYSVVIILGVANLIADGISMAAGNYSGVKAENDEYVKLREMERRHIAHVPEGEREEVRQIFANKGFEEEDLDRAVSIISADKERWIDFMLTEEFGAARARRSPLISAISTFSAFVLCGSVPLLPYALRLDNSFPIAIVATGFVFFAIGTVKSRWSMTPWWLSGLGTFMIGSLAALTAYMIGAGLKGLVD